MAKLKPAAKAQAGGALDGISKGEWGARSTGSIRSLGERYMLRLLYSLRFSGKTSSGRLLMMENPDAASGDSLMRRIYINMGTMESLAGRRLIRKEWPDYVSLTSEGLGVIVSEDGETGRLENGIRPSVFRELRENGIEGAEAEFLTNALHVVGYNDRMVNYLLRNRGVAAPHWVSGFNELNFICTVMLHNVALVNFSEVEKMDVLRAAGILEACGADVKLLKPRNGEGRYMVRFAAGRNERNFLFALAVAAGSEVGPEETFLK